MATARLRKLDNKLALAKPASAAYWFSDLINAGSWSQVSAFVVLGLTWWQSILAVFLGGLIISIVIALNGIIGARIHTPFAITSRASFGYIGSRFPVISRMVIAWFWFSVNSFQGGLSVKLMLIAIWPSFRNFKNHLPASSGTTSQDMLCFFLFWLLQFPLTFIHPRKLQPVFLLKAVSLPLVAIGMTGWAIWKAGDQRSAVLSQKGELSGTAFFFAFATAVSNTASTWSTMSCSIGDFSRYCKNPSAAWIQVASVPLLWTITAILGAIVSNMMLAVYGEVLYQPFDVIDKWLLNPTSAGRAAAFFCSLAWGLGNATTNLTANSISAANDMAVLFPKYINLFRGQLFCAVVGCWAFCPWLVLASAQSFLSFMASYAVILAPLAAILASDYFLVKRKKYDVVALYDPSSIYRYTWGINWRAFVALACGAGPNLPGMAKSLNSDVEIGNLRWVYCMSIIFGLTVASSVHWILHRVFPDRRSIIETEITSVDVLAGFVPQYAHMAESASSHDNSSFDKEAASEETKARRHS
ncbi:hypothetical protein OIV83_003368 [Microbotryomycetes sp. JL201]|nr:hypothetical protein OIV83_003368 [Microbotryomycetes sp. JL201]